MNNAEPELKRRVEDAFSRHIDAGYQVRETQEIIVRHNTLGHQSIVEWTVEYPDGCQVGGTCYITEENGYSVCISMRYSQESGSWRFSTAEWYHGFLTT